MFDKFYLNARKPEGLGGKLLLSRMNRFGHARLAEWGFDLLAKDAELSEMRAVMDVGCGGGANISRLLCNCPNATVFGLDYSTVSVNKSLKHNKKAVKEGRCVVEQGDVTKLAFDDNKFDLITAFETIYFWKPVEVAFSEIFRTLAKGGRFFICNDAGGAEWIPGKRSKMLDMTVYDEKDLRELLSETGFSNVKIYIETDGRICAIAEK